MNEEDPGSRTRPRAAGPRPSGDRSEPAAADRATDDPGGEGRFSRRGFLGGAAGLALSLGALRGRAPELVARLEHEHERLLDSGRANAEMPELTPDIVLAVERDTDLLLLDFFFFDFKFDTSSHPRRLVAGPGNIIVVQFPPQAIGEAVYLYPPQGSSLLMDPPPILSDLSGPSRLSFSIEKGKSIPLPKMSPADLLDWTGWNLNVAPGARASASSPITTPVEPTPTQTWIECPYALVLSPVVYAGRSILDGFDQWFENRSVPLTSSGITDCWSTSLAGSSVFDVESKQAYTPIVAAVWATDYATAEATAPETQIKYTP